MGKGSPVDPLAGEPVRCVLDSALHPLHPDNPQNMVFSAHIAVAWSLARKACECERCRSE